MPYFRESSGMLKEKPSLAITPGCGGRSTRASSTLRRPLRKLPDDPAKVVIRAKSIGCNHDAHV